MKESTAWRECAEWVMVVPNRRGYLCHRLNHDLYSSDWQRDATPGHWPNRAMLTRLRDHAEGSQYGVLDKHRRADKHNQTRALFCLLMERECLQEETGYNRVA